MDYKDVSTVLAVALVSLPRITMSDLYDKCKEGGKIGNINIAQFRLDVSKWLHDGTIPGYESRKGPTGGIYKKGTLNESKQKVSGPTVEMVEADVIIDFLDTYLSNNPRIKTSDLYDQLNISVPLPLFKIQLSVWLKNGTIDGYELRKGPTGGVYKKGADLEKFNPNFHSTSDTDHTNDEFTLQITPSIRIVKADERNWAVQKKSGENWMNRYYHPDLESSVKCIVRHVMNNEFKLANSTVLQLNETRSFLKDMEDRIFTQLQSIINKEV